MAARRHLNREIFHSCRLPEVVGAVRAISALFPAARLYLGGFSLGGNFMLRVAADSRHPRRWLLSSRCRRCSIPKPRCSALEQGPTLYQRYFVKRWTRSLRAKQRAWPDERDYRTAAALAESAPHDRGSGRALHRLRQSYGLSRPAMRSPAIAARYACACRRASCSRPTIRSSRRRICPCWRSRSAPIVRTRYGGHCGFVDYLSGPSFADRYMLEEFEQIDAQSGEGGRRA